MREHFNKRKRNPKRFFFFLLVAAATLSLGGAVVMWLWNTILPVVTGVKIINYWQALGLLILCRILFGSFKTGAGGGRFATGRPSRQLRQKFMQMSEEEKAEFKEKWKGKRTENNC